MQLMPFWIVVECKVCGDLMKSRAIFCEVCALICHEECKKLAFSCPPKVKDQQPSYDVRVFSGVCNTMASNLILHYDVVGVFCQNLQSKSTGSDIH